MWFFCVSQINARHYWIFKIVFYSNGTVYQFHLPEIPYIFSIVSNISVELLVRIFIFVQVYNNISKFSCVCQKFRPDPDIEFFSCITTCSNIIAHAQELRVENFHSTVTLFYDFSGDVNLKWILLLFWRIHSWSHCFYPVLSHWTTLMFTPSLCILFSKWTNIYVN